MTTSPNAQRTALLSEGEHRALVGTLNREFWKRVRGQCQERPWPGRLTAWDVSPEGRVLAGVQTRAALVWLDAGPLPAVSPEDPRMQALLADRQAREALWREGRRSWQPPRGR